jgi:GDP-4-dehydro-6-deoxy-D-mannose reductase
VLEADLLHPGQLSEAVEESRPDEAYHLAALSSVRLSVEDPGEAFRVNTLGTRNLLEAIRQVRSRARILIVSSAEAYGVSASLPRPLHETDPLLPVTPYGASKAAAEALVCRYGTEHGLDLVRVRPFPHTGPRHGSQFVLPNWARQLTQAESGQQSPRLRVGNLDIRRDLTDVRDVVRAYVLALEQGETGAVYNVCSGRAHSLREVLELLLGLASLEVEVIVEAERVRLWDLPVLAGSPRAVQARTGWEPSIPLAKTLADLLTYWRSRVQNPPLPHR